MDISTIGGWVGGVLGVVIGGAGAGIGTYFTIKHTQGIRERQLAVRASIACWLLILAFVAGMLLIPGWYRHLLWIPYTILLAIGVRSWNKTQARIRQAVSRYHSRI